MPRKNIGEMFYRVGIIHIVEHPAQIPFSAQFPGAGRNLLAQAELRGKFPAAKAGLVIKLPFLEPASHDVLKFSGIVSGRRFLRHLKMSLDHIPHIPQQQSGPLLDLL